MGRWSSTERWVVYSKSLLRGRQQPGGFVRRGGEWPCWDNVCAGNEVLGIVGKPCASPGQRENHKGSMFKWMGSGVMQMVIRFG